MPVAPKRLELWNIHIFNKSLLSTIFINYGVTIKNVRANRHVGKMVGHMKNLVIPLVPAQIKILEIPFKACF